MNKNIVIGILTLIVIVLGVSYYKGQIDKNEIVISKPTALLVGEKSFFGCESLIDAGFDTGPFSSYDKIFGRINKSSGNYPFQIEGDKLFLTRIDDGRRFELKIFSNDNGFLGAAETWPSIYGPITKTFILNKLTGLSVFTESGITGGSSDPSMGVS